MKIEEVRQKYYSDNSINPVETQNFLLKELIEREEKANELLIKIENNAKLESDDHYISDFFILLFAITSIAIAFCVPGIAQMIGGFFNAGLLIVSLCSAISIFLLYITIGKYKAIRNLK